MRATTQLSSAEAALAGFMYGKGVYVEGQCMCLLQAEDREGETPLSVAATKGLRQALVDVATGKAKPEDFDDELMES